MTSPTMLDIKHAIDGTATAVEQFKQTHAAETAALRERIEQLEALRMNPGPTAGKGASQRPADAVVLGDTCLPILRKSSDFAAHYRAAADAADLQDLTLADFCRGIAGAKTSAAATKALSVGVGSGGGHAVPEVLMPRILEALTPASAVLEAGGGIVDVSTMDAKSHSWAGIATIPSAAWRAEAGAVAESEPTFRLVTAEAKSLSFYFKVSRELLADAPNIDQALQQVIAQAFARELDRASLRGSGSAPEPRGVLHTADVGAVGNGASGATQSSVRWNNLHSAVSTILGFDAPPPSAAIMAPRSLVGYSALADTTNQPLERPTLLRSMQFLATSQIPVNLTVGGSSDCTEVYVGDFSKVLLVMRERPAIMRADQAFALNGQVAFVCHVRADIVVTYPRCFAIITGLRAN